MGTSSADRPITIAAVIVVLLSLYALFAAWGGLMVVPLLAGLAALVILYLPAIAPNTKAPGSKGSLLMVSGVLAALFWLLATLTWLGYITNNFVSFDVIIFLIGFAASLWFGWLAWSAFQAEGGKFQFGNTDMSGTTAGAAAASTAPPADAPAAPPPAAPPASTPPPAAPPSDSGMSSPPPNDGGSAGGSGDGGSSA